MINVDGQSLSIDKACELGIRKYLDNHMAEAQEIFCSVIRVNPQQPRALNALAVIALDNGEYDQAHVYLDKVLTAHPFFEKAFNTRGTVLVKQGKIKEAIENFNKAISLNPSFVEPYGNLANIYYKKGKYDEAITAYRLAISLIPSLFHAHYGLGAALHAKKEYTEAIKSYRKVLEINPEFSNAHAALAETFNEMGRHKEAKNEIIAALRIEPDNSHFLGTLGNFFLVQGFVHEAITWYRRAIKSSPDNLKDYSNLLLAMHYLDDYSPFQILQESQKWSEVQAQSNIARHPLLKNSPIRIGYVSADFRNHVVTYFLEPLLAAHDHNHFKIYCYSDVAVPDDKTRQLMSLVDDWTNIAGMSDQDVYEKIVSDEIDILIDLAGHTANNRLPLFMKRPAPIQATWLGYPGTTGLNAIDYRISDQIADPEGMTEKFHAESIIRLKDGFLCYLPPKHCPDVTLAPAMQQRQITFGSFNNLSKITQNVLSVWGKLLNRVPDSRLLLKSKYFEDEESCERIYEILSAEGVARERITFRPFVMGTTRHLASYQDMDIALDTFPYNGTTTTFESLLMGVPVITFMGGHHAARVGASILSRIGLEDHIATTLEDYIDKAESLAKNLPLIIQLRQTLRDRLLNSTLCNAESFAKNMENAFRQMLENSKDHMTKAGDK